MMGISKMLKAKVPLKLTGFGQTWLERPSEGHELCRDCSGGWGLVPRKLLEVVFCLALRLCFSNWALDIVSKLSMMI